jgi:hypothetical protein
LNFYCPYIQYDLVAPSIEILNQILKQLEKLKKIC